MTRAATPLDRSQQHRQAAFEAMGLKVRPMADGRALLVSLPVGPAPFDGPAGPIETSGILFATVGLHDIKCLRPRVLFGLPLVDLRDARDPAAIEATIRRAVQERTRALRQTARALGELGLEARTGTQALHLELPIPGESPDASLALTADARIVLPGSGPLAGLALDDPSERVVPMPAKLDSGADFECLVAARIDALRRRARKREAEARVDRARSRPSIAAPARVAEALDPPRVLAAVPMRRRPRVLVVGQRLIEHRGLREALRREGYRIATARSEPEALLRLAGTTPDLVLCEFGLGRSDGATLVQATRSLVGIEGIPVVLLDDVRHEGRREAARAVGAAGYVIGPADPARFVARLRKLIEQPSQRRYTRYAQRLDAHLRGWSEPCLATEVGRGGIFIATDADIDRHVAMQCALRLPEVDQELRFEAEVLYRADVQGGLPGLGLRFSEISAEDEAALIDFLARLEGRAGRPA